MTPQDKESVKKELRKEMEEFRMCECCLMVVPLDEIVSLVASHDRCLECVEGALWSKNDKA